MSGRCLFAPPEGTGQDGITYCLHGLTLSISHMPCSSHVSLYLTILSVAGLVFFAFGLNMVDCGGLLGGRLGSNVPAKQTKAKMEPALGTPTIGRTYTL